MKYGNIKHYAIFAILGLGIGACSTITKTAQTGVFMGRQYTLTEIYTPESFSEEESTEYELKIGGKIFDCGKYLQVCFREAKEYFKKSKPAKIPDTINIPDTPKSGVLETHEVEGGD